MSTLGNLLKIVAIGAFFIATGPFGLTIGSTLATALRIGGMVLGYLGAIVDRPRLLNQRNDAMQSMSLSPGTPLPVVYGRGRVGAVVADWFLVPDTSKILYYITALCHGSRDGLGIASMDHIWLDQREAVDLVAVAISTSSASNPSTITTSSPHGFSTGDTVRISGHSKTSLNTFFQVTVTGLATFTVPLLGGGTGGVVDTRWLFPYRSPTVGFASSLGTATQNVGATAFFGHAAPSAVSGSGWSATTDAGAGIAVLSLALLNVQVTGLTGDVGPLFHGPPSVAIIVRGNRIYDSRTTMWTAGGDNPPMCIRDYLLAPIYGCDFDQTLIHEQSFKDAADYCDTLVKHVVSAPVTVTSSSVANPSVITATAHGFGTSGTFMVRIAGHSGSTPSINADYTATYVSANSFSIPVNVTVGGTGGTVVKLVQIKRHTCNGVVDTARATSDNLQELLSSCRGNLVWEQGQFKLTIRSELVASPTITLSPSNIIGEWSFRNAGLEEKWNSVTATYIEPANGEFKTQDVQWPMVGTTNSYLTSDGGFTNRLQLSLPFTNDQLMAQMLAQITLNEARLGISCSVRCTEEALAASVGDKVYVTHPTPGWTLKQFWVTALQLMPDTTVVVSLQEYDSTAYDLGTMEDRRSFPATTLDSVFSVPVPGAVTTVFLSGGGLKISWGSAAYGLIDFYEVQARLTSAGEDYVTIERVRESSVLQAVAPLARAGQLWDARVRVVNVAGWPSEWVDAPQLSIPIPGAATPGAGQLTWVGFAPTCIPTHNPPDLTAVTDTPSGGDLCFTGVSWNHLIGWTVTGPDDTLYQTDIDEATDAAGVTFVNVITGLTTASSSVNYDTGIAVNLYGSTSPTTYYRKYKVKIIRKSDSAVIDSMTTTQATIIGYSENCA